MTLQGWTLPQSTTGKAAILPRPPWHYSGDIIATDFTADPDRVAELMPSGMEPQGDGSGSFVFADWCSAADADPRIQSDPSSGQYKEAYCILYGRYGEKKVGRIPYIWVDSDLSLVRGLVQGFPKKFGDIAMTRPVDIGKGGVRKRAGSTFRGHVSSHGRRVVTLSVELDETMTDFYPPAVARPLLHTRLFPALEGGEPAVHEYQRGVIADFEIGEVHAGNAILEFGASEFEEIDDLGPVTVGRGYVHTLAFSVTGGRVEPIPEP